MTVDRGHRIPRIRLQGQSKDVYQAESRIKEMLHKIRAELMEQQEAEKGNRFNNLGTFHNYTPCNTSLIICQINELISPYHIRTKIDSQNNWTF